MDADDIKNHKLTEEEKTAVIKEIALFAFIAFCLYVLQIILPPVLRALVRFIHSFTQ